MNKARRAFDAPGLLLEGGHEDFAASQTYYGLFYVAVALLLSKSLRLSRHGQIIGQCGRLFAKSGELDPSYHRLLIETFEVCQSATHDAGPDGPT